MSVSAAPDDGAPSHPGPAPPLPPTPGPGSADPSTAPTAPPRRPVRRPSPREYQIPGIAHAVLVHAAITRGRIRRIDTDRAEAPSRRRRRPDPPQRADAGPGPRAGPTSWPQHHGDRQPVRYLNTDEVLLRRAADRGGRRRPPGGGPVRGVPRRRRLRRGARARRLRRGAGPRRAGPPVARHADRGRPQGRRAGGPRPPRRTGSTCASPPRSQNHNAMEPHATTAVWDGDRLTVWDDSQNVDWFRKHLARGSTCPWRRCGCWRRSSAAASAARASSGRARSSPSWPPGPSGARSGWPSPVKGSTAPSAVARPPRSGSRSARPPTAA